MLVFDVVVNGEVKETIQPKTSKLKDVYNYVTNQIKIMKVRYGSNVKIERRMHYS